MSAAVDHYGDMETTQQAAPEGDKEQDSKSSENPSPTYNNINSSSHSAGIDTLHLKFPALPDLTVLGIFKSHKTIGRLWGYSIAHNIRLDLPNGAELRIYQQPRVNESLLQMNLCEWSSIFGAAFVLQRLYGNALAEALIQRLHMYVEVEKGVEEVLQEAKLSRKYKTSDFDSAAGRRVRHGANTTSYSLSRKFGNEKAFCVHFYNSGRKRKLPHPLTRISLEFNRQDKSPIAKFTHLAHLKEKSLFRENLEFLEIVPRTGLTQVQEDRLKEFLSLVHAKGLSLAIATTRESSSNYPRDYDGKVFDFARAEYRLDETFNSWLSNRLISPMSDLEFCLGHKPLEDLKKLRLPAFSSSREESHENRMKHAARMFQLYIAGVSTDLDQLDEFYREFIHHKVTSATSATGRRFGLLEDRVTGAEQLIESMRGLLKIYVTTAGVPGVKVKRNSPDEANHHLNDDDE